MPRFWIRKQGTETVTTTGTLALALLMYNNQKVVISGAITIQQKVTVVATHLFAITNTDDTFSMGLVTLDESDTVTYSHPQADATGGSDKELKGHYVVARGPVLYSPRRLISVPVEETLWFRINKEVGGNTSTINWACQILLNVSQ